MPLLRQNLGEEHWMCIPTNTKSQPLTPLQCCWSQFSQKRTMGVQNCNQTFTGWREPPRRSARKIAARPILGQIWTSLGVVPAPVFSRGPLPYSPGDSRQLPATPGNCRRLPAIPATLSAKRRTAVEASDNATTWLHRSHQPQKGAPQICGIMHTRRGAAASCCQGNCPTGLQTRRSRLGFRS